MVAKECRIVRKYSPSGGCLLVHGPAQMLALSLRYGAASAARWIEHPVVRTSDGQNIRWSEYAVVRTSATSTAVLDCGVIDTA